MATETASEDEIVQPVSPPAAAGEPSPSAEKHSSMRNGAVSRCAALLWTARRLPVPTRRELEALHRKIKALDQRLAALRRQRKEAPPVPPADAPPPAES